MNTKKLLVFTVVLLAMGLLLAACANFDFSALHGGGDHRLHHRRRLCHGQADKGRFLSTLGTSLPGGAFFTKKRSLFWRERILNPGEIYVIIKL